MTERILVTGANGFLGRALLERLRGQGPVRAALRGGTLDGVELAHVGDLGPDTDWRDALAGVDAVVHAAARVHVLGERGPASLAAFRRANVQGTLGLAAQAAEAGVRRFVYISSIKVNGETTPAGHAFRADDPPAPVDPYGISKREAEDGLRALAAGSGMELVIIRPPLVYGPGVKANFHTMMRVLRRGLPLPLGAVRNRRSLVALDNLTDLIATCLRHPAAAQRTFLVSDGEDLSTPELLRRLGAALERPARLLPMPPALLRAAATLVGRGAQAQRLLGSLQVDMTDTRATLGWTPPVGVDAALAATARDFLARERP